MSKYFPLELFLLVVIMAVAGFVAGSEYVKRRAIAHHVLFYDEPTKSWQWANSEGCD